MNTLTIAPRPTALRLSTVATSTRQAHRTDLGTTLRAGLMHVGHVAEQGLRVAAPWLPTGALVSAARAGSAPGAFESGVRSGPSISGGGDLSSVMDATERMTELNASYNLRYLALQQRIQADTREFNMVSNVLKTKHDAAKNALNNIR